MGECLVCHNETQKRIITYVQEYQEKLVAVKDVPAEVCPICGEQYFNPDTVDKIQNVIYSQKTKITLDIPLYEFEASRVGLGCTPAMPGC